MEKFFNYLDAINNLIDMIGRIIVVVGGLIWFLLKKSKKGYRIAFVLSTISILLSTLSNIWYFVFNMNLLGYITLAIGIFSFLLGIVYIAVGLKQKREDKKETFSKFTSAVLVVTVLFAIVPGVIGFIRYDKTTNSSGTISPSEVQEYEIEGTKLVGYNGSQTNVIIPSEFNGKKIESIGDGAFKNRSSIIKVTIPEGMFSIGEEAFAGCTGLREIVIPESLTSIGKKAFSGCENLTTGIIIPDSVLSIGESAFNGCKNLTTVTIGNGVTTLPASLFYGCSKLESITLPFVGSSKDASVASATTLFGYVFGTENYDGSYEAEQYYDASNNKKYYIPSTLQNVSITGGNILYGAFSKCGKLTGVTLPDETNVGERVFDGCKVKNYQGPIAGVYQLDKSQLEIAVMTSGDSIAAEAFKNCANLTSVTIPDSVTSIGEGAFGGCSSLESITLPFVGAKAGVTSSDTYQYPFGYIFGTSSYTGGTETKQYYYGSSTSSTTSSTYCIPSTLKNVTITGGNILYGAFYKCSGLTSITIPDSVTSIGDYAFYGCKKLTSITIPDSVTSIGDDAFRECSGLTTVNWNAINCTTAGSSSSPIFGGCTKLATVNIGNSVKTIPSYAFYNCSSLTSITIPDSVTSIGESAFYECSGLTAVHITDLAAWCNISFGNAYANPFYYAKKLYLNGELVTNLVIPDSVTSIGNYAFEYCSGLTSVTIPDSVTSIGKYAFYNCSGLTSITIPDSVTSIDGYAFEYCSGLTSITIPDSVTSIGNYAFRRCSGLTSITIPDSVTSIGEYAFEYCSGLTSVTIPDSVTSIGKYAFAFCYKLVEVWNKSSLTITKGSTSNGWVGYCALNVYTEEGGSKLLTDENGFAIYDGTTLVGYEGTAADITIQDTIKTIYQYAFEDCSGLTSVTIGNSVTSIGNSAFSGCSGLTAVYITDLAAWCNISFGNEYANPLYYAKNLYLNGEKIKGDLVIPDTVTKIPTYAFSGCSGLTRITIPDSVESIGEYAFEYCSGLTSVTIPDSVTSIGKYAFSGCSSLKSITLPFVGNRAGVTSSSTYQYPFGYIFGTSSYTGGTETKQYYYGSSTGSTTSSTYYIPSSLKSVTITGGNILYGAFYNCSGLTRITIGNSVTSIDGYAFEYCSGLTSVTIGNSVTSIGDSAFYRCSGLTSITIPDSVTSIGNFAFSECSGLTSVTIGNSVTSIGRYAFSGCSSLSSVTFADTTTWYRTINSTNWQNKTNGTLTSVTNASTNATYFNSTYKNYYWYKL